MCTHTCMHHLKIILTMLVQALANIMYLGLNATHWIGPGWLPSNTVSFCPLSDPQTWTRPSWEPVQQCKRQHLPVSEGNVMKYSSKVSSLILSNWKKLLSYSKIARIDIHIYGCEIFYLRWHIVHQEWSKLQLE